MIELNNVSKTFQDIQAIDHVSTQIQDGLISGIIGTNGAGKSTLLRLMCGVLKSDAGTITLDGESVFEQPSVKKNLCFLSDTAYFFPNSTPKVMKDYYALLYPSFDGPRFDHLADAFSIDQTRKISTLSKGVKKQISLLLGLCSTTRYLFCDETFDGLDPVVRQAVKSLFASELLERNFTPIIASHNLRELEDICDRIGLLHNGKILFMQDLEGAKTSLSKVHCVMRDPALESQLLSELQILQYEKSGSLLIVTARGSKEDIWSAVSEKDPVFAEILPLSLEELFISETEVIGYDFKKFFS